MLSNDQIKSAVAEAFEAWSKSTRAADSGYNGLTDLIAERLAALQPPAPVDEATAMQGGRWYAAEDIDRMVLALDRAMNGDGAASAPKLCDIYSQLLERCAPASPAPSQWRATHRHADGGEYRLIGHVSVKHPATGEWDPNWKLYDGADGVQRATDLQRWLDRFTSLPPAAEGTGA